MVKDEKTFVFSCVAMEGKTYIDRNELLGWLMDRAQRSPGKAQVYNEIVLSLLTMKETEEL